MRIGIDIDDTITNSWDDLIPIYSELFDIPIDKLKKSKPYYEAIKDKITIEEYFEILSTIYEKHIQNVSLKADVKEVIDKLYELGHTIIFITARGKEYIDAHKTSKDYLDKYGIKYEKIVTNSLDKAKKCIEENIDLFIDDSIKHCTAVSEKGIEVIMLETLYNKDIKDFKHAKNWQEVYEYIKNRG